MARLAGLLGLGVAVLVGCTQTTLESNEGDLASSGPVGQSDSGRSPIAGTPGISTPEVVGPGSESEASPGSDRECLEVIAGVGPEFTPRQRARQAVVVSGDGLKATQTTVSWWERDSRCWHRVGGVRGWNGSAGWARDPADKSNLSPIGVFTLTDAGGRLKNPGTRMPYSWDPGSFTGPAGESDGRDIFNYVVAVNINRYAGHSPAYLSPRPVESPSLTFGIWIHPSRGRATRGCMSLPEDSMRELLRWLDPDKYPVVIAGPSQTISQ